jgi:hypothetical protein
MKEIDGFIIKRKEEQEKKHTDKGDNYFYASDAFKCPRELFYKKRIKKDPDLALLKVFYLGEMIHEFYQKNIPGQDEVECKLEDNGIIVSGRIDKIHQDGTIIEFKSTSAVKYNQDAPKAEHVAQINLYLKIKGEKKGKLVYIDKKSMEEAEHYVEYNEGVFNKTMGIFHEVNKCLQANTLPSRVETFDKKKYPCSYCNYQEECRMDKIPEKVVEK